MKIEDLDLGDVVYAAHAITDDDSMPSGMRGEVLVEAGARGIITMIGHVEDQPERSVFIVRFEDRNLNLGSPIGCGPDDLSLEQRHRTVRRELELS